MLRQTDMALHARNRSNEQIFTNSPGKIDSNSVIRHHEDQSGLACGLELNSSYMHFIMIGQSYTTYQELSRLARQGQMISQ
jgi:hypothetical protein